MTKTWWEAPMGGSVLRFCKAEWKVSDTFLWIDCDNGFRQYSNGRPPLVMFFPKRSPLCVQYYNVSSEARIDTSTNYVYLRGRSGRYRMIVGITTTRAISCGFNPVHGQVYSIQHYMIKCVSDLRQVGGFLLILRFSPPIKLTATI